MKTTVKAGAMGVALLTMMSPAFVEARVDANLPEYTRVSGVSGNLNSMGSDTLNNLMQLWAEGFREIYPNVNVQIEGAGSGTAPVALIEGTAQIGPMSREMRGSEVERFEQAYGYAPAQVNVAIDGIAVYVHRENPVEGLTLQQIDGIFSSTNRLGGSPVNTWWQTGLTGPWANRSISVYGRNSASGTYGFFRNVALGGGDFRGSVAEQPGSSAVVQSVAANRFGIGYSGIGYMTSGVRAVPVSQDGEIFYEVTAENCINGDYPIARFLILYVNKNPREGLDTLTYEFLRFALSKQGQEIVAREGFFPLPASVAKATLESLK